MTPTTPTRPMRLVAITLAFVLAGGVAWAYWTAGSVPGGNGASAATSVNQGATPTASATANAVTLSWAAGTLSSGQAVSGYQVKRYDAVTSDVQTILSSCTGTITTTTCTESAVPAGSWKYAIIPVFATNWLGAESAKSAAVTVAAADSTPPANAISLSGITGGASKTANTVYYRGLAAGSFTLTNAVSDAGSGPASSATAALTGTPTGWTHTPSTVSTPSGGPYVSNPFSWVAATTSAPSEAVTGRDVAGNATATTVSFVNDSSAPSAGTISYPNGSQVGLSVPVTFTTGTDAGAGIATRQLERQSAPLTGGICGSYGSFTNRGPVNPTSVYTDSQVSNGACYKYRYVVTDRVGNQHIATSTDVAKVDYADAINTTPGLLSHWRLGESAASLTASDSFTAPAGTLLSAHTGGGTTWTRWVNDTITAFATNANRMRRDSVAGPAAYHSSNLPSSANYRVEADVVVKSVTTGDTIAVIGRWDTTATTGAGTYYTAQYVTTKLRWELVRRNNGVNTALGTFGQTLTAGRTYRLGLDMSGSTIRLLVDGVQRVSVLDAAPITAAGRAGLRFGTTSQNPPSSDTAGPHIDNFQVTPSTYPRAADSKGTNTGDYFNGVQLGVSGAIAGDTDTAATFDGANDYMQTLTTNGFPVGAATRTVETWFKTPGPAAGQKRQTLFNYGTLANTQEFGVWLENNGTQIKSWGYFSDVLFTFPNNFNDDEWHHFVQTYDGTTITMYIDGVAATPQNSVRNTVINQYGFGIAAVVDPNIGTQSTEGFFNGSLDEVAFYTTALNQATVTSHHQLGTSPPLDATGPTGGSVDASGLVGTGSRYSTSTVLSLDLVEGTDPSGVAATGAQLLRATAPLTSGACGTFGSYTLVTGGTDPVSPKADTVTDQACYRYQYVVSDTLGNPTTYTSGDIKVDTTAPTAPSLAFSAFTNTAATGSTVYYRSAASTGAFTATATATDAASGIASYAYPALGTNWTSTPGSLGVHTYSWSGAPAAPGTKNVTATNNATGASPNAPFTLTADNTAPGAGTVTYPDTTQTSTSVSVSFTTGTDGGSGLGIRLLQRSSATLTGSTCGTYGAFSTVTGGTNPATSPVTDTAPPASCHKYQYVVSDRVGNQHTATSANVVKVQVAASYFDTISATVGLLNYWRLGESAASLVSSDSFTGTTGALLTSRSGETGATWAYEAGSANTEQISDAGRARRNGTGYSIMNTTATPASANYSVEADLFVRSNLVGDKVGVIGRLYLGATAFYLARWDPQNTSWNIMIHNGTMTSLAAAPGQPALVVGQTYRLKLTMTGSTLQLYVDGVLITSATDTTLTGAGKAGIMDGEIGGTASKSNTTGIHVDNFQVTPSTYPRATDSKGTNSGDYANGVTLGAAGALAQDANTAATFDGVHDYVRATSTTGIPVGASSRSVETWFKTTSSARQVLFSYGAPVSTQQFGLSLNAGGSTMTASGYGAGNDKVFTLAAAVNDGGWHHVVKTYDGTSITLYIDGVALASQAATRATVMDAHGFVIGAVTNSVDPNFGGYFNGTLDEVSLYTSVLTPATVTAHRNAGL